MDIKTLTGPSIQAALAEARQLLGDDVMLLESVAARDGAPARITVMVDAALDRQPAAPAAAPVAEPSFVAAAPAAYGYAAQRARPLGAGPEERAAPPAFSSPRSDAGSAPARSRLFTPEPAPAPAPAVDLAAIEALLDARLTRLHDRIAALEAGLGASGTVLGAAKQWLAHPLYGDLLTRGLRPETADRLFHAVVERGFRSDDRSAETLGEIRWAIAQELRGLLHRPTSPHDATGTLVLVGPSGAGKTSLLLKLALHPSFYGRRRTAALVLVPEDADVHPHQSPAELYRRHGLPVMVASTPAEVRQALARTADFDQLLIDTPPLHPRSGEARKMMEWLQGLLAEVGAFDVHLVLDATRALEGFGTEYLRSLPLRPTAASLTRLDETDGWGRVAEWMLALDLPVQFVSTSPRVPDGLRKFTPGWFVEQVTHADAAEAGDLSLWN